jgi:hypothetical protein
VALFVALLPLGGVLPAAPPGLLGQPLLVVAALVAPIVLVALVTSLPSVALLIPVLVLVLILLVPIPALTLVACELPLLVALL